MALAPLLWSTIWSCKMVWMQMLGGRVPKVMFFDQKGHFILRNWPENWLEINL